MDTVWVDGDGEFCGGREGFRGFCGGREGFRAREFCGGGVLFDFEGMGLWCVGEEMFLVVVWFESVVFFGVEVEIKVGVIEFGDDENAF